MRLGISERFLCCFSSFLLSTNLDVLSVMSMITTIFEKKSKTKEGPRQIHSYNTAIGHNKIRFKSNEVLFQGLSFILAIRKG